jgi:hypothetical protein
MSGEDTELSKNELALQVVGRLVMAAIEARIPGDNCEYASGSVVAVTVAKATIIRTVRWMISKTNSFTTTVVFNFRHGEAPAVALILSDILRGVSKQLFEMDKNGLSTPWITSGWYSGPHDPYIRVSDLTRDMNKNDAVAIYIHGKKQQVFHLAEITS